MATSQPVREKLVLLPEEQEVVDRYQEIFRLRNVAGEEGVEGLIKAFNEHPSNLLRHEICYALGQTRETRAVPFLRKCLEDVNENGMVRHEAAEALGAIGDMESMELLKKFLNDPAKEVSQTCELAIARLQWSAKQQGVEEEILSTSGYLSVDPAPPPPMDSDVTTLKQTLQSPSVPMFDRYRAMFGLRNKGGDESVKVLCDVLLSDTDSALLRHELAYVLGQMQNKTSAPALAEVLADLSQHDMVRHEAAEALGCIAPESHKELLEKYRRDPNHVIAHSCQVALAMYEEDFEYA